MGALSVTQDLGKPASSRADCSACCRANATAMDRQMAGSPVATKGKQKRNYNKPFSGIDMLNSPLDLMKPALLGLLGSSSMRRSMGMSLAPGGL